MSHNNQTLSLVAWRRMYFSTHLFIHTYAMYVCVCWVLFCSIVQRFLIIDSPSEAAVAMLSRYDVLLCSHCTHYCTALLSSSPALVFFFAVLASAQCIPLAAVVRRTFRFARTTYASSIFCNPMQTTPLCCGSSASEITRLPATQILCPLCGGKS